MNISRFFIHRPIATCLLSLGLLLLGGIIYEWLPVASLPSVDFPMIHLSVREPGASPETMAATVAAPLERRIGKIPGVTELNSTSTQGSTSIQVQFALERNIDSAALDVQQAINAAQADLPSGLSRQPTVRKINPSDMPILILGMTSKTLPGRQVYDAADTVVAQRIAQVQGVADVTVAGSQKPAIRVAVDPGALAHMGVGLDSVRQAISNANVTAPLGSFDGVSRRLSIGVNDQLDSVDGYRSIAVKSNAGTVVPLRDVAAVTQGTENRLQAGWLDGRPAVLLLVHKANGANVVDTVKRIKALLPKLGRWIPAGINITIFGDRTNTIKASIDDLQFTLMASIALVMLVVLLFLRRGAPTLAAGVTVPLSLAGTVALMWLCGFSLNNLSLMALTISVGFVVDDAIVMIENISRNLEQGKRPLRAALIGARQIGFTVISISLSLIAAFSPLIIMPGLMGRLLREFSLTLAFAIAVSAVVSLSVTPAICSRFIRRAPRPGETRLDRLVEPLLAGISAFYAATLRRVLHHRKTMLAVTLLAIAATVGLFIHVPKTLLPQGDTGLIIGLTQVDPDTSFDHMEKLQRRVERVVMKDPSVAHIGSFIGSSGGFGASNQGRMFISLKPRSERKVSVFQVINRLRPKLAAIKGVRAFLIAGQMLPMHAGQSMKGTEQSTLWSPNIDQLYAWASKIVQRLRNVPDLINVATDRDQSAPEARLVIDRLAAARLGVNVRDIDAALNNAFSQRQISTIYRARNQYKVVLEITPRLQRETDDLRRIYVSASDGTQVPLSAVTKITRSVAPLSVNHEGQFPSVTVSYDPARGTSASTAQTRIQAAIDQLHPPDSVHMTFGGYDTLANAGNEGLLILGALVAVYLVLGILYESLVHPLTIISTLPSAGVGALLALYITQTELSLVSLIGVILLIGIVKKNGIMLVDFALEAERERGWAPEKAIYEAAKARFRPITMTTLAAALGAVPLVVASGPGAELRRPLGITIIGGLIVSQFLTIYTTPVLYLMLDRLRPAQRRKLRSAARLMRDASRR